MKKRLIALLTALVVLICMAPVGVTAATAGEEAYLMYADSSWTYQNWGTEDGNGVKVTSAKINGSGDYKVGLDFSGTADGAASGIAFTALGIMTGEFTYPNATIEIKSIKINDENVAFTKGYTSSDDGITTRMNIYNEWVSELPSDARSFDEEIAESKAIMVDKAAFASVKKIEVSFTLHENKDEAFLMFADSSWTYQYWNDGAESAVEAKKVTVKGPGEYTVGLDFTKTADKKASGIAFAAVGISKGEKKFPNYCITIKNIKVNGKAIEVKKGYTSSDDGIVTRMNIYNEWVTELPADARSSDASTEGANWIIVDKAAFDSIETIEVTFDYSIPKAQAFIMFADAAWKYQYFGDPVDTGVVATDATVTGAGSYKVALDFTKTEDKAATDVAFTALGIKGGDITHPGWYIRIDSIKVNGEDVALTKGYTSSDDGVETRMNIYNEWVTELPADAHSFDKNLDEASAKIVDKAAFASVKTMEVAFTYIRGEKPVKAEAAPIDVDAALAADYNAYFGIQTETYIFRNAWNEPNYGKDKDNFTHLTGWDADSNQVDYGGTFTDAAVDGNGTFTVGVKLGDMALGTDKTIRMLFVSTDIPSQLIDQGLVTISDVKTSIDGGKGQTAFTANTEGEFLQLDILNEYTSTGVEAIPYTIPAKEVTITFTVAGLSKNSTAQAPTTAAEPTTAPADTATSTQTPATAETVNQPNTGLIIAIVAVVVIGVAVFLFLNSKKKKNDK
ncbi:MAG: hypothetical protein GX115_00700 [Ruminiclostridium sp.]|nr:hypothetical protein [Ruminiclostridium sp.]